MAEEGFQNDALRAALTAALAGRPAELERLLCRLGAALSTKPNLKLAAAFGGEMAMLAGPAVPLLNRLGGDDAAPDTDRVFLPIAAAHGWAGRLRSGRDVEEAWAALGELAADERAPVRLGARDVLVLLGTRERGGDELVARGEQWLELPDRELRFGAAALVIEALTDRRVLTAVRDRERLFDYLSRAMAEVSSAPRSAERSDGRRRLLLALPATLAAVLTERNDAEAAQAWLSAECAQAVHPDLRAALSNTVVTLADRAHGNHVTLAASLRAVMGLSAKPLRDPTRLRPGTGRGKTTRRMR
jgi:uncharacterized protein YciU (UPF0263 family)